MITFREIDKSNYMECICLKVKDEQRGFVADNARSLAEARFEEGLYTRAVYSDGVMVGKEAVLRFLDFMREHMGVRELYLHVELENTAAHEMYQKLGFRAVREIQYTFDGVVYRERRMKICL